jgi:hypothetical protein
MRVHRTQHQRSFTILANGVLQDRRLSYTARGLLADLPSRKDGWREDGRHMADSSIQGRGAIRKALKELTEAGYYRVDKIRMPDGTVRSEAHVFDTPQLLPVPDATRPGAGEAAPGPADAPPVKEPVQAPSLPDELPDEPTANDQSEDESEREDREVGERLRAAVAALFQVIRPEPRVRLGQAEAAELAPLVAQWLERGSTPGELAQALLPGLPPIVHSPVALLRSRLERKMPSSPVPRQATPAGRSVPIAAPGGGAAIAPAGAARVRAALRAARTAAKAAAEPRGGAGGLALTAMAAG